MMTIAMKSPDLVVALSLIILRLSAQCNQTGWNQWKNNEFFRISWGEPPGASVIFLGFSLISQRQAKDFRLKHFTHHMQPAKCVKRDQQNASQQQRINGRTVGSSGVTGEHPPGASVILFVFSLISQRLLGNTVSHYMQPAICVKRGQKNASQKQGVNGTRQ